MSEAAFGGGQALGEPAPHSAGIAVAFKFAQEDDDPSPRCGQLNCHDVPNEIEIHSKVVVSELVSHPGHLRSMALACHRHIVR